MYKIYRGNIDQGFEEFKSENEAKEFLSCWYDDLHNADQLGGETYEEFLSIFEIKEI